MDSGSSNEPMRQRESSSSGAGEDLQWVRMPDLAKVERSVSTGQRRTFVIVSRPLPGSSPGKAIRHILIFDNHPASLDLVFKRRAALYHHEPGPQRVKGIHIAYVLILAVVLLVAMFWPVL